MNQNRNLYQHRFSLVSSIALFLILTFSLAVPRSAYAQGNAVGGNKPAGIILYTISGNAGVAGVSLSYTDGTPKTVTADINGDYSFSVPSGWSGIVTPSKSNYIFQPTNITYNNVTANQTEQYYTAITFLNFTSNAANDGWVLESSETSSQGSAYDNSDIVINVGDDTGNEQYRSILDFNTAPLPDSATIVGAELKIMQQGITGTNPFTTHGDLIVDIRNPSFGASSSLEPTDFQAVANRNTVGIFGSAPSDGWYTANLDSTAYGFVSRINTTQFRLRFIADDDDDNTADYLNFYSGDGAIANRPILTVYFYNELLPVISGDINVVGASLSYTDDMITTSNEDGSYSLGVPSGWSGTITPIKLGWSFTPDHINYTNVLSDQTNQDFTGTRYAFVISGNTGTADTTLNYYDSGPQSVNTDKYGNYTLLVSPNWSGTVTPSNAGYIFTPTSITYNNTSADWSDQNYTASEGNTITVVSSINRLDPDPTSKSSLNFLVTFSGPVTGVDANDFALTFTGATGATISSVSGSGDSYTVTLDTSSVKGNSMIRLDVMDDDSILDTSSNPLGGTGIGNGNFTSGETYTLLRVPTPLAPANVITDSTPTYKWSEITEATQYQYQLVKGSKTIFTKTVPASACSSAFCSNTPTTGLGLGTYKWRVRTMIGGVWMNYSPYKTFKLFPAKPGLWKGRGLEFYVIPAAPKVDNFAIYISVTGCGNHKVTHYPLAAISNKKFSFTGSFYANGTFTTPTKAKGVVGLNNFYIPGCGYVSGGPFSWTAVWKNNGQPDMTLNNGDIAEFTVTSELNTPFDIFTIDLEK